VAGVALAGLVMVASGAAFFVAADAKRTADSTVEQAERLYTARLGVARAQEDLGRSDLDSAITSAGQANATADKVKAVTTRIAGLLEAAEATAAATARTSRRAVGNVTLTRRQTVASGDVLAAIAGYQRAASTFAADTNSALRRILTALRETNRSFPGGR